MGNKFSSSTGAAPQKRPGAAAPEKRTALDLAAIIKAGEKRDKELRERQNAEAAALKRKRDEKRAEQEKFDDERAAADLPGVVQSRQSVTAAGVDSDDDSIVSAAAVASASPAVVRRPSSAASPLSNNSAAAKIGPPGTEIELKILSGFDVGVDLRTQVEIDADLEREQKEADDRASGKHARAVIPPPEPHWTDCFSCPSVVVEPPEANGPHKTRQDLEELIKGILDFRNEDSVAASFWANQVWFKSLGAGSQYVERLHERYSAPACIARLSSRSRMNEGYLDKMKRLASVSAAQTSYFSCFSGPNGFFSAPLLRTDATRDFIKALSQIDLKDTTSSYYRINRWKENVFDRVNLAATVAKVAL